jgi:hypothetical protein
MVKDSKTKIGVAIVLMFIFMVFFFSSFNDEKKAEPTAKTTQQVQPIEVGNMPISEEKYKARIFSEGEKISKAGIYIMQAGKLYNIGDYDKCEETLYEAADIFRDVNWTFKGQANPPLKYAEFNKNMIVIFSDISDSIDNMATAIANRDKNGYGKETKILNGLIAKANTEMTKAGF